MFIAGILLYEGIGSRRVPTPPAWLGAAALAVALLMPPFLSEASAWYALRTVLLFVAFCVLCLSCFRAPSVWLARSFAWTPARWLGNMSYSFYLLHGLALKGAMLLLAFLLPPVSGGSLAFWGLLPVMFGLTLIPTSALFFAVERPFSLAPALRMQAKSRSQVSAARISSAEGAAAGAMATLGSCESSPGPV